MAAETHQTTTPAADSTVVLPRSEETQTPSGDPTAKAALEAKERMAKTQGFWNRLSPEQEGKKADKPAEAKPEKPAKEEKADGETPAQTPETKPEKKAKGRRREPEVDPIQIAQATGQAIGREMAKAARPVQQPTATPAEEPELPEEYRADIAVFDEMARLDPKKYGNIKKDIARYAKAESDYIAKWESENDGQTFDGDAEEHNSFYEKIQPKYDQKDFKAAEKSLLKSELRNDVKKELAEELRTRETESERRRERASQIQPDVDREMFGIVGDMIREADPASAELGKDVESLRKLEQENPLLSDVLVQVHNDTKPVLAATVRLFRSVESFDKNNPAHQRIANVIADGEQKISRLPIKERYDDDGRLFATQADYAKMTPEEQARHWYIGERETVALLRGQAIAQTKEIYQRERQRVERYSKRPNAAQTNNPAPTNKRETEPSTRADNGSPSVSGRGTLPGDGQNLATRPQTGKDSFFSRMLGA